MSSKILVVEDDKNIREVVAEYLKDAGYIVVTAEDGYKTNELISQSDNIDLYILDIMLPKVTGLELLKTIRKLNNAPVLMLTALEDEQTQYTCFDSQADDYVIKPFSPKLLVKRAEALLRRVGHTNQINLGPISLDLDRYDAFEDGEKVILTLKELELLKVLMLHQGKVLTRQQLLDSVWGYDYYGDERIVDVHIKNVRKKFKSDIIRTIKGVGYTIKERAGDRNV